MGCGLPFFFGGLWAYGFRVMAGLAWLRRSLVEGPVEARRRQKVQGLLRLQQGGSLGSLGASASPSPSPLQGEGHANSLPPFVFMWGQRCSSKGGIADECRVILTLTLFVGIFFPNLHFFSCFEEGGVYWS